MYINYNPNPYERKIDDCTIRALSKVLRISWRQAHDITAAESRDMGYIQDAKPVWGRVLREAGFHKSVIPEEMPDDYTIKDFCDDHPTGEYIVATSSHVVAIINGDYYDSFDSGDEIPVYYWWRY